MKILRAGFIILFLYFGLTWHRCVAQKPDRNIFIETIITAPVPEVWQAWTTSEGLESFLAPRCNIEPKIGGMIDIYFNPDAPEGQKGAEGLQILAFEPYKMLSFTWNKLTEFPEIQKQQTHVTLKFFPLANNKTRLILIHDGWGDGEIWDQAYQYFTRTWPDEVLFRLHYRFDRGPVNWNNPPINSARYNIIIH